MRIYTYFSYVHMSLFFHPEKATISSKAAAAAARAECRARPFEMFTFQFWVVFNHTAGCLTAHSTAWPLFTSPCFRPALYAQSGRPRDDLSGQLLRFLAKQQRRLAERKGSMTLYRKCSGLTDAISISKLCTKPAHL